MLEKPTPQQVADLQDIWHYALACMGKENAISDNPSILQRLEAADGIYRYLTCSDWHERAFNTNEGPLSDALITSDRVMNMQQVYKVGFMVLQRCKMLEHEFNIDCSCGYFKDDPEYIKKHE